LKKLLCLLLALCAVCTLCACSHIHVRDDPAPKFEGTFTGKVVDKRDNTLLIVNWAEDARDEDAGLYFAPTKSAPEIAVGDVIEVGYSGLIFETFPSELGGVKTAEVLSQSPDTAGLYREAFRALWETEPGLNEGVTELAFDFAAAPDMTPGEKRAVAYLCGSELAGCFGQLGSLSELRPDEPEAWMVMEASGVAETGDGFTFTVTKRPLAGAASASLADCTAKKDGNGYVFTAGTLETED